MWPRRRGCNRGDIDRFTCSAISAKGSTSECSAEPCALALVSDDPGRHACQRPRGRIRARTGSVEVHEAATRLGVAKAEVPRQVVAAPEYPTAATPACYAAMRAHEEPRIIVVRRPPPALPRACVGYNRLSRKGKADPSSSTRGLWCVAAAREVATEAIRQGLRRSCERVPPRPSGARHYATSSLAQPRTSDRYRGPSASDLELHRGCYMFSSRSSESCE